MHPQRPHSQAGPPEAVRSREGRDFHEEVASFRAMTLTREDVEKVALLARLRLSEAEIVAMTEQLGRVLGYVEQLSELDTDNVQPMAHAIELENVLVDDVVQPSLDREVALANAPKRDAECYRVPAVLGE
jgi:aspartyl-tRNA(Asn)/glutamyl-tRNA(Gln) amidotransferase subunit C